MNSALNIAASLDSADLLRIISYRAEYDQILRKVLLLNEIFKRTEEEQLLIGAIKSAFDFGKIRSFLPDNAGYDQILDEIFEQLKRLEHNGNRKLAVILARFTVLEGSKVEEHFDEGWFWHQQLEAINDWIVRNPVC